jgi:opacity protein-like surface antigen
VDGSDEESSRVPTIGGGGQWKLAGDRIDFGLEGMMAFGWRANALAFASGGGGAVVAIDVSLFLIELYGGPFVSLFLGERWRVYGAAGPMLQWASYDQESDVDGYSEDGSGFGTGWYARTGLEFAIRPGMMVGGGVRWSDSVVDLDSGLGDLDLEGVQWVFTVTTGI